MTSKGRAITINSERSRTRGNSLQITCVEDNGHLSQNLDRNSEQAFIVIFERDNVRNQVMNDDETLDFVNFDDYKGLEPNPPFLLFTIKHIHSVFFSRFRPSKTIAYKTSPVLIDQ